MSTAIILPFINLYALNIIELVDIVDGRNDQKTLAVDKSTVDNSKDAVTFQYG